MKRPAIKSPAFIHPKLPSHDYRLKEIFIGTWEGNKVVVETGETSFQLVTANVYDGKCLAWVKYAASTGAHRVMEALPLKQKAQS